VGRGRVGMVCGGEERERGGGGGGSRKLHNEEHHDVCSLPSGKGG